MWNQARKKRSSLWIIRRILKVIWNKARKWNTKKYIFWKLQNYWWKAEKNKNSKKNIHSRPQPTFDSKRTRFFSADRRPNWLIRYEVNKSLWYQWRRVFPSPIWLAKWILQRQQNWRNLRPTFNLLIRLGIRRLGSCWKWFRNKIQIASKRTLSLAAHRLQSWHKMWSWKHQISLLIFIKAPGDFRTRLQIHRIGWRLRRKKTQIISKSWQNLETRWFK